MTKISIESQIKELNTLILSNKLDDATKKVENLIKQFPNSHVLFNALGVIELKKNNLEQSIKEFNKAININPNYTDGYINIGAIHENLKNYDLSEEFYKEALNKNENSVNALLRLSLLLCKLKRENEAIDYLNKILVINPNSYEALIEKGRILMNEGDYSEAKDLFIKAYDIKPDELIPAFNLGGAYRKLGDLKSAKDIFAQLLNKFPNNFHVLTALGDLSTETGDYINAKRYFENSLSINPNNGNTYAGMGRLHNELGEGLKANNYFLKAVEIDPNNQLNCYQLAKSFNEETEQSREMAIKYYKMSKYGDYKEQLLHLIYKSNNKTEFKSIYSELLAEKNISRTVAAISQHYSFHNRIDNEYRFCPNQLDFVRKKELEILVNDNDLIKLIKEYAKSKIRDKKVQSLLNNGYQSPGNLFSEVDDTNMIIKDLILNEIEAYRNNYKNEDCLFIKEWPDKTLLKAWVIKMEKDGFLKSHIHPLGWISGVIYLDVPNKNKDEGNIELGYEGYNYPSKNKEKTPKKIIDVYAGDILLFPSSLFHQTIPFTSNNERICIAFDLNVEN